MQELPNFWGSRNAGGKIFVGVPSLAKVIFSENLDRAIASRYLIVGPALAAARQQVMAQIGPDLKPPPRQREKWWVHRWQSM